MKTIVLSNLSDEQVILEYLDGNISALGILYDRYYQKVYHKCLSFTKNTDDAFDFAQDILLKSFSNAKYFKGRSKFSTWLFSITHNYCVTQMTKLNKVRFEDINMRFDIFDESMDTNEFEERKQREEREMLLNNYMNELSELDRSMLELKYHHNYSIKDLQDKFNLSASAVKMRLSRARQKVEQIYSTHKAA